MKAEEIAVLYRIHTDARGVVEELIERKIPFQMRENMANLYDHFIAKDLQAYFRMAEGEITRSDFLQVMNRPKRYISRESVSGTQKITMEQLRIFYEEKEWMQDRIDQLGLGSPDAEKDGSVCSDPICAQADRL